MMAWLIVALLVILAAACNAVMDKIETLISYNASRFVNRDKKFWCKPYSAHHVGFLPFTKFRADGWHLAKSLMIVLLMSALLTARYAAFVFETQWVEFVVAIAALGVIWNYSFNFFYWWLTVVD